METTAAQVFCRRCPLLVSSKISSNSLFPDIGEAAVMSLFTI
jgi:hypothetical protein